MTVYVMPGFDRYEQLLAELGPHSTGKSCLYLKRLDAITNEQVQRLKPVGLPTVAHGGGKQAGRERRLAVRQGFEPWVQVLARTTV